MLGPLRRQSRDARYFRVHQLGWLLASIRARAGDAAARKIRRGVAEESRQASLGRRLAELPHIPADRV